MDVCEYTQPIGVPQQRDTAVPVVALPGTPALPSSLGGVPVSRRAHPSPDGVPGTSGSGLSRFLRLIQPFLEKFGLSCHRSRSRFR